MYLPKHFAELRIEVMHELINDRSLATLVTLGSDGLEANPIPFHLSSEPKPYGTLRGHVARSNPVWKDFDQDTGALAIFHGPESYITPSWYPTKAETGKAVPTWNYVTAHAYGMLHIIEDATWLRSHLDTLTLHNEAAFPHPWQLSDAPADYLNKLMAEIVGIEIVITRLIGKWKTSQNQPQQNQAGIVLGLRASKHTDALQMASLVEKHHVP